MCMWNPLSSLLYIVLDEKQLQSWIIYKDRSILFEGLMITAHLNVIKSEFINMSRQNGREAITLTPTGYRSSPKEDPFLAVAWSNIRWYPGGHSIRALNSTENRPQTRPYSVLSGLWLHQNMLPSLVDFLKYFILITLETIKKKKNNLSDRRRQCIHGCRVVSSLWLLGQTCTARPLHHTPASFRVNTSNPQACLINHSAQEPMEQSSHYPESCRKGPPRSGCKAKQN